MPGKCDFQVRVRGIIAFFRSMLDPLWNRMTLQRYSPEQQKTQTGNRGPSNVVVNIGDLSGEKKRDKIAIMRARNSKLRPSSNRKR